MPVGKSAAALVVSVAMAAPVPATVATVLPAGSQFGTFAGSSPCGESIRRLLQIPLATDAHLIEWKVTLYQDEKTGAPTNYHLHYKYGLTTPGRPGLGTTAGTMERRGSWRKAKGAKGHPEAVVYELDGTVSLLEVSDHVVHVLNGDRSLMVGNGGWSYTLNRSDASEARVDALAEAAGAEESRTVSAVASGPSVFGIFEGRSPCQRIAHALKIPVRAGCTKVKWRVTLYQDPETRDPTNYKVESSLHRSGAREGRWTILRGTEIDPHAIVYRLAPAQSEAALFIMKGDDNVLFVMDQNRRLLTGHAEFSYTLNRRKS